MNLKNKFHIDQFVEYKHNELKHIDKNINPNKLVYCDSCYKCCRVKNLHKHINSYRHLGNIGVDVICYAPFKRYDVLQ